MARIFQDTKERRTMGAKAPWWVEWRENGRRRSQKIGARAAAKKIKSVKEAESVQRRNGLPIDKPWPDFVKEYEETAIAKMRSIRSRDESRRVLKLFGDVMRPQCVGLIDRRTLDLYAAKRLKAPGKRKGDTLSVETVKKELRTVHAALSVAHDWHYLGSFFKCPTVDGFGSDKRFVSMEHFEAILAALEREPDDGDLWKQRLPRDLRRPVLALDPSIPPEAFWRAMLCFLWVTGMRIGAVLEVRWDNIDREGSRVKSRARHNKQKKDSWVYIAPAVDLLDGIRTSDPRVFPWNYDRTCLDNHFHRLQRGAGIHLPCEGEHEHTPKCHTYGFHDFRRAHATYNYSRVTDDELQRQMGHATFATTRRYIDFAKANQGKAYDAVLPDSMRKGGVA